MVEIVTPGGTELSVIPTPDGKNTALVMNVRNAPPPPVGIGAVHLILSPDNVRELIIELEKHEAM